MILAIVSENDIIERLARIETKLEVLVTTERVAAVEESVKQAHRRITDAEVLVKETEKRVYWTAGLVFAAVEFILKVVLR